jgi:hypothetical protein
MSEPRPALPPEIAAELALWPPHERAAALRLVDVAPEHPNLLRTLQGLRLDGFVVTTSGVIEIRRLPWWRRVFRRR